MESVGWFVDRFRELILFRGYQPSWRDLLAPLGSLALFWLGLKFFRRFSGHFEDFL
jgi:hypothetical protein